MGNKKISNKKLWECRNGRKIVRRLYSPAAVVQDTKVNIFYTKTCNRINVDEFYLPSL
jgi:hypothetical protein